MEIAKSQGFVPCRSFQRLSRPVSPPRLSASSQECRPFFLYIHKQLFYGRFGDFGQESLGLFFNSGSPHSATRQSKRRQHVLDSLVSQVLVRKQAQMVQIGPEKVREWSENSPRMIREWSENGPRWPENGPRWPENGPKACWSKSLPTPGLSKAVQKLRHTQEC